jgi:proteasome accessory factor A
METDLSVDTMHNRPILNTRDEPHANREHFRRLHLILGDANMCEYATAMKIGTTRVVLDMIAEGFVPSWDLADPVQAIQTFSQDPDLKTVVKRQQGGTISGLDIQRAYVQEARNVLTNIDEETHWILQEWEQVLHQLEHDPLQLIGKIDWVTKRWLLETFVQDEGIEWDDPWLASLDLEYHNVDPERGLFFGLEAEGRTTSISQEDSIQEAMKDGPLDTRGGLRGLCVQRFGEDITSMQWEGVHFRDPVSVAHCRSVLEEANTPWDMIESINKSPSFVRRG